MVSISSKAVATLREQLIHKCYESGVGFRMLVSTNKSGKATFSIKLDRQHQGDEVIDLGSVKVFLNPSSAAQISDYQLDYQGEPAGGFFLRITQERKQ